jgi:hypothetical protein
MLISRAATIHGLADFPGCLVQIKNRLVACFVSSTKILTEKKRQWANTSGTGLYLSYN